MSVEADESNEPRRIGILISGRGSNMLALARAAQDGRIKNAQVVIVVSDRADAHGIELARELGIATRIVERRNRPRAEHEREIIGALEEHGVDLVCLAGYMRLLSPLFIARFRNSILNIHPSLLPAFPGLDAQRQAIDYGVKFSGCTVHFVDETLDGGAIIAQRVVEVLDADTAESLAARIIEQEHGCYVEAVGRIVRGEYETEGRRILTKSCS